MLYLSIFDVDRTIDYPTMYLFDLVGWQEYNRTAFTCYDFIRNRLVRTSRPKNLNLFTIRFPIPAIVSILHRISGFFLFLLIPFILWVFAFSLTPAGFSTLQDWFSMIWIKMIVWLLLIPFCYHLIAGVRHLLSDIHLGDSLKGGRRGAVLTFIVSFLLIILAGVWLW